MILINNLESNIIFICYVVKGLGSPDLSTMLLHTYAEINYVTTTGNVIYCLSAGPCDVMLLVLSGFTD